MCGRKTMEDAGVVQALAYHHLTPNPPLAPARAAVVHLHSQPTALKMHLAPYKTMGPVGRGPAFCLMQPRGSN